MTGHERFCVPRGQVVRPTHLHGAGYGLHTLAWLRGSKLVLIVYYYCSLIFYYSYDQIYLSLLFRDSQGPASSSYAFKRTASPNVR